LKIAILSNLLGSRTSYKKIADILGPISQLSAHSRGNGN
jgi:hypothetical protein